MAQQFCTQCGAHIDAPSQKFCTKCGAPIALAAPQAWSGSQPQPTAPVAGVQTEGRRLDGFDTPATGDWETSSTQYAPYDAPSYRYGGDTAQMPPAYPLEQPARGLNPIIIAAIVAAVILLLAVGYALLSSHGATSEPASSSGLASTSSSSEADQPSEPSDESSSSSASSTSSTRAGEVDEDAVYDELVDMYEEMGAQADRIKNVAGVLNNTIFTADKQKRQNAARESYDLQDEIAALKKRLEKLSSSYTGARYSDDIETLVELQQDLCNRIDVMCEAWDLSLSYSNPKKHDAEILKPLARDNDSKGVNVYKKDFESRYPAARPSR